MRPPHPGGPGGPGEPPPDGGPPGPAGPPAPWPGPLGFVDGLFSGLCSTISSWYATILFHMQ